MNINVMRPRLCQESRGAKAEAWGVDIPSLNTLWKSVNQIRYCVVLRLRNVIVDGIALVGWPACPWLSRLVDRLTMLADALAEKSGARA